MRGKMTTLARQYDQLTPEERMRAVAEAMARGDEEEFDRLVDTCPRFTYKTADNNFVSRMDALETIGVSFTTGWFEGLAKYWMVAGQYLRCCVLNLTKEEPPKAEGLTEKENALLWDQEFWMEQVRARLRDIKAVIEATKQFCEEVAGIDYDTFVKAFTPLGDKIDQEMETFPPLESDPTPEQVGEFYNHYVSFWERSVGRRDRERAKRNFFEKRRNG